MEECPNCKYKNPSAAKYCMACAVASVKEEPKTESVFLLKPNNSQLHQTVRLAWLLLSIEQFAKEEICQLHKYVLYHISWMHFLRGIWESK